MSILSLIDWSEQRPRRGGANASPNVATRHPERCKDLLALRVVEVGERLASSGAPPDLYYSGAKVKGMPKVSSKNQVTIPVAAMRAAGLRAGDEITVRPVGEGEIVIASRGSRVRRHAGIAKGIYKDGELDRLRDEWQR